MVLVFQYGMTSGDTGGGGYNGNTGGNGVGNRSLLFNDNYNIHNKVNPRESEINFQGNKDLIIYLDHHFQIWDLPQVRVDAAVEDRDKVMGTYLEEQCLQETHRVTLFLYVHAVAIRNVLVVRLRSFSWWWVTWMRTRH